jgi:uncharacterized LabA/DUF88 family protein
MDRKKQKVYAFIDSQNLNLSVKSMGWSLDFRKFRVYLRDKFKVEQAFLFIGQKAENASLYTALQKYGYILVFKPVLEKNGVVKGNVDAELVLHTMIEYENYDKAILVTGDGDFHCIAEYLESNGKLGGIVIPNKNSYSSLLRRFNKYFYFVSSSKNKLSK